MGRFYTGGINGKFGVACQSSDDGEYFGAVERDNSVTPYVIFEEDIPEALYIFERLITEFNQNAKPKKKLTTKMSVNDIYDLVDNEWLQNNTNLLLLSRLAMGFEIARFAREHPGDDLYFDAEI